ncbi:MAG TPA: rSAM-associated Gly-rich repeat protein [Cyanothece sp. UBA12306]|nr:rSAM-associated Gly-rich repeat protein [Cyanothece sp. UBA12306]
MKITTNTGLVSFLLALSALNIPTAHATISQPNSNEKPITERLNRINRTIKEQEAQLPKIPSDVKDYLIIGAWGNGSGGGGFVNRRIGWGDGSAGGGFVNRGGGGWSDGGGFANRGGGFANGGGGGGFANRGGGFVNR